MTQIKPIAMRCNEEQFNAIRPKLERAGLEIEDITFFHKHYYLTNNLGNKLGMVSNIDNGAKPEYGRTVFEEWNEQTFLEYCGIVSKEPRMVTTADIGAKVIRGRDWKWGGQDFGSVYGVIVVQKSNGYVRVVWKDKNNNVICENSYRIGADGCYDLYYYEEESIKQEQIKKYKNYTVPATDVLEIRAIACSTWKKRFTEYLNRMDEHNMVAFDDAEIDEMFKAALEEQRPVLVEVFGEPAKAIEWDRIKTGSKVMIQHTGQHCSGINSIDLSKPVDVVFYKTPHCINNQGVFYTEASHSSYCAFHQNGKYVLFAADKNVDYITEVIEY